MTDFTVNPADETPGNEPEAVDSQASDAAREPAETTQPAAEPEQESAEAPHESVAAPSVNQLAIEAAPSTEDSAAEEHEPTSGRVQRIPSVITTRSLFFLAPDLPPRLERPTRNRRDEDERDDEEDDEESQPRGRQGRNRRNRRQSGNQRRDTPRDDEDRNDGDDEPELITEPQKVHGSTRLEAKRQRRREGRETGRRRTVVTESEFMARREAVDRKMIVRAKDGLVQIGVLEDNILVEHYVARNEEASLIGNVYLGRVQNVLPSMEAAFVDIGRARNAVLYSGEVDWQASQLQNGQPRRIENALKSGDRVLVQVTKDPVGHKGARLTSQVSLPGRYLVYVPGNSMNGISRKLPDTERTRLKKILKEVLPEGVGVIVRTAAEGATKEQLEIDVKRLLRQWEQIQSQAGNHKAPQTLHAEPDMLIKIIRDVFNEDFDKLIIQGSSELQTIRGYLEQVAPDLLDRVEPYEGKDIFTTFRAQEQIDKALARKVWLPSGGSLVIDRTEAMTVIDVNTGKFVGSGGNLEETVTKNNLEAAEEIVRQLRLRDIGGIIVVDFIDMVLETNRDLVSRRLIEGLSRDRTKHQVAEVTSLGLVQMTRKKIGLGLLETFSEPCEVCDGRGVRIQGEPVDHTHTKGADRQRGGNNGNTNNKRNRGKGNQQEQESSKPQANGAHEITEDARSALTKIAASTIAGAVSDDDAQTQAAIEDAAGRVAAAIVATQGDADMVRAATDAERQQAGDDRGEGEKQGRKRSRRGRRNRNRDQETEQPLLLPEAAERAREQGPERKVDERGLDALLDSIPGNSSREAEGRPNQRERQPRAQREPRENASAPAEQREVDAPPVQKTQARQEASAKQDAPAAERSPEAPAGAPKSEPQSDIDAPKRRRRGERRRITTGPIAPES